ncbi:hypothetical protein CRUP_018744 [Coryphaenoides rupestris]|nr:hypothetical protein CRUP_018744 [Coryphaenoides rupestris]
MSVARRLPCARHTVKMTTPLPDSPRMKISMVSSVSRLWPLLVVSERRNSRSSLKKGTALRDLHCSASRRQYSREIRSPGSRWVTWRTPPEENSVSSTCAPVRGRGAARLDFNSFEPSTAVAVFSLSSLGSERLGRYLVSDDLCVGEVLATAATGMSTPNAVATKRGPSFHVESAAAMPGPYRATRPGSSTNSSGGSGRGRRASSADRPIRLDVEGGRGAAYSATRRRRQRGQATRVSVVVVLGLGPGAPRWGPSSLGGPGPDSMVHYAWGQL